MSKLIWIYARNPIESATKNSCKKMEKISLDFDLKLGAIPLDPIIGPMYTIFHPIRISFHDTYVSYKFALNDSQGTTKAIVKMWKDASATGYDAWDTAVKKVYPKDSKKHDSIFPNGHEPFRTGSYAERITFIEALHKACDIDGSLDDAKALVNAFLTDYGTLSAEHVAKQKLVRDLSALLKSKRKICASAMFSTLGDLIKNYPDKPDTICSYFDLEEIIKSTPKADGGESEELTIELIKNTIKEAGFAFLPTTKIRVYNSGITNLALFTGATKANPVIPEEPYILHPEEEFDIEMSTLGLITNRFFFIANTSTTDDGEIVIDVVN